MQKWEYTVVTFENADKKKAMQLLNQMGDQGWEVVSIIPTHSVGNTPPGLRGALANIRHYSEVERLDAYLRRPRP